MKYRDRNGNFKELLLKPSGDTLPIGSQIPFSSSKIPGNWLECNGQAVSRTEYVDLFRVIGTSYGEGDGETTFNVPDKRGRQSVGINADDTDFNTLGKTGGEKSHTQTVDELAKHKHSIGWTNEGATGSGSGTLMRNYDMSTAYAYHTRETGQSKPFNVMDPYEVDCWIIKAKNAIGLVGNVVDTMESENPSDVANVKTVKKYIDKNIISVRLNKVQNVTTTDITNINFNTIFSQDGDNLKLENGKVKIGKNIKKVLVSCNIWTENNAGYSWINIVRLRGNDKKTISANMKASKMGIESWSTQSIAPVLVDVQENDEIGVTAYFSVSANNNAIAGNYEGAVSLTVQEV